jgi:hypothetical protein
MSDRKTFASAVNRATAFSKGFGVHGFWNGTEPHRGGGGARGGARRGAQAGVGGGAATPVASAGAQAKADAVRVAQRQGAVEVARAPATPAAASARFSARDELSRLEAGGAPRKLRTRQQEALMREAIATSRVRNNEDPKVSAIISSLGGNNGTKLPIYAGGPRQAPAPARAASAAAAGPNAAAIDRVANNMHDAWRKEFVAANGAGAQRWKPVNPESAAWIAANPRAIPKTQIRTNPETGQQEINIAGLRNKQLPPNQHGKENADGARHAVETVARNPRASVDEHAAAVHQAWLARNGSWAPASQKVPYNRLSDADKEKDRVIVRAAMRALGVKPEPTTPARAAANAAAGAARSSASGGATSLSAARRTLDEAQERFRGASATYRDGGGSAESVANANRALQNAQAAWARARTENAARSTEIKRAPGESRTVAYLRAAEGNLSSTQRIVQSMASQSRAEVVAVARELGLPVRANTTKANALAMISGRAAKSESDAALNERIRNGA